MARVAVKRRKIDTWKTKKWYNILAPKIFGGVKIGETLASNPEQLIGRVIEATMKDITGDFTKQHIKLRFKITEVRGNNAYTRFEGQRLSREYMRSQIRRKSTRVEGIVDAITKDGHKLRIRVIALAFGRAQTSQECAIRRILVDMVKTAAEEREFDSFVQEVVSGKIAASMYRAASKIYPLKRVEVRKIKVLEYPAQNVKPAEEAPAVEA
ncbi:30S ribosomal protein S3ae [Candidatus Pyrohabitans sp.]